MLCDVNVQWTEEIFKIIWWPNDDDDNEDGYDNDEDGYDNDEDGYYLTD